MAFCLFVPPGFMDIKHIYGYLTAVFRLRSVCYSGNSSSIYCTFWDDLDGRSSAACEVRNSSVVCKLWDSVRIVVSNHDPIFTWWISFRVPRAATIKVEGHASLMILCQPLFGTFLEFNWPDGCGLMVWDRWVAGWMDGCCRSKCVFSWLFFCWIVQHEL